MPDNRKGYTLLTHGAVEAILPCGISCPQFWHTVEFWSKKAAQAWARNAEDIQN